MNNDRENRRYPIAAVRERLRRQPGPVLDFAVGRHRERPPAALRDLIAKHTDEALLTPCSADELESFSSAAAAMLDRVYGLDIPPTSVMAVPGGRTAMSFLASTLIRPGDDVVVVEPAYPAFARVARQIHARVHDVPLDCHRDFEPDGSVLSADEKALTSFVALNYPNNPTGAVISPAALAGFLGAFEPGTIVFNDATYGPLVFDRPPWSMLAEAGESNGSLRFVELHSLAKLFGLGPMAVSFVVGEERIMAELREFSEYAWSDQSSLQIQVALGCMNDGERFEVVRRVFLERLERLRTTLEGLGFEPFPAASGMYIVCRTPSAIGGKPVADAEEAAEVLLQDHGVAIVPWQVRPTSYLRFSSQYTEEDLVSLQGLGQHGPIASP